MDVTSSSLDRLAIYAALGVPEVWRFDGEGIRVYHLRADQTYAARPQSLAFPFLPMADLLPFLQQRDALDDTALARALRDWIRQRVVPLWPGSGPQAT